tara:strand:- start:389 stop:598 length:210 start_codon:yes stop_codon:yes gene_type:complete
MAKEKFLLYMLAGIFTFQAGIFGVGLYYCANNGGLQSCPKLGDRYEQTFNVMIATTLALLTGSALSTKE